MNYKNWQEYQKALAAYNSAKLEHESALKKLNEKLASFNKDSDQSSAVQVGRFIRRPLNEPCTSTRTQSVPRSSRQSLCA
jgi:hypothetical protein